MSSGSGPCKKCRAETDRFDMEHSRFACTRCFPEPTASERAMAALLTPQDLASLELPAVEVERRPGESRQEWRRRMRTVSAPQPQQAQSVDKFRSALRAEQEVRHSNDPWRHHGARGTWGGA